MSWIAEQIFVRLNYSLDRLVLARLDANNGNDDSAILQLHLPFVAAEIPAQKTSLASL